MLGKLTIEAVPYHEPIIMVALGGAGLLGLLIAGAITKYKLWGYLWKEWFTSLAQDRDVIADWRRHYNQIRPHSSCGRIPPAQFAANYRTQQANNAVPFNPGLYQ